MARSLYRVPRGRRWGPARGQRAAPRLEGGSASAAQPAGQPETRQPGGPGRARCGCRKHAGSCCRSGVRQQRRAAERGPLAKLAAAPVSSGCGFSGDSRLTASPCPLACACRACGPPLATRTSRGAAAPWAALPRPAGASSHGVCGDADSRPSQRPGGRAAWSGAALRGSPFGCRLCCPRGARSPVPCAAWGTWPFTHFTYPTQQEPGLGVGWLLPHPRW